MKECCLMLITIFLLGGCADEPLKNKEQEADISTSSGFVEFPSWVEKVVIGEVDIVSIIDGGGLESFSERIPLLKELGVGSIILNPLFPLGQTYELEEKSECLSYKRLDEIDRSVDSISELKKLIQLLHLNGIKVLLDWPLNKLGFDNVWLDEHHLWFKRTETNRLVKRENANDFCLTTLDYYNNAVRKGMIDVMNGWVEDFEIDGFRFDAEENIATSFWVELHDHFSKSEKRLLFLAQDSREVNYDMKHFHAVEGIGFENVLNALAGAGHVSRVLNSYASKSNRELGKGYYFHSASLMASDDSKENAALILAQQLLVLMIEGIPVLSESILTPILRDIKGDISNAGTGNFADQLKLLVALKVSNGALVSDPYLLNTSVVEINDRFVHFKREAGVNRVDVILNLTDKPYTHSFSAEYRGRNYLTGEREHWFPQADQSLGPYGFKIIVKD